MSVDPNLARAAEQTEGVLRGQTRAPHVKTFFDKPTFTATHVVHDPATNSAVIIDSVLDFDQPARHTPTSRLRRFAYSTIQVLHVRRSRAFSASGINMSKTY
jgi:hypothetical protein